MEILFKLLNWLDYIWFSFNLQNQDISRWNWISGTLVLDSEWTLLELDLFKSYLMN